MAQITYRANLSAKTFPFISENFGRSVIVAGPDQNFTRQLVSSEDQDKDIGIAQLYYCHNVMPYANGWQAVGYTSILPSAASGDFTTIFLLRDGSDNKTFFGLTASGLWYVSDGSGAPWVYKTTIGAGQLVTTAYVAGITYIHVANVGTYKYDFVSSAFVSVPLIGIEPTNILGITYSAGYLIAWTKPVTSSIRDCATSDASADLVFATGTSGLSVGQMVTGAGIPDGTTITEIVSSAAVTMSAPATATAASVLLTFGGIPSAVWWSSTIDPTDFTPSLVSGAGGGAVESARGKINYCIPHTLGFIIGTADNCVAALYQNNTRYPFQFRELVNSGGMTSLDLVAFDANTTSVYAYTTSGMQLVSTAQTQTVMPEITDFISGRYFEDFDDSTETFSTTVLNAAMKKKLAVVTDRYMVISYGINSLTHAIVYDLITKRYGKLKIDHVQAFTYHLATPGILETPKQSLAFLKANGAVQTVDFSIGSPSLNGTMILGKYQYVRPRMLQLDQIFLESVRTNQSFNLKILTALDGKNNVLSQPDLTHSEGLAREYSCRAIGMNHSLLFRGGFSIDSLLLQFNIHGKR